MMDIDEARRRLAEHPPKGDPTNIAFGEALTEKAARLGGESTAVAPHQPQRGDEVEAWLKAQRDEYRRYGDTWNSLDNLLNAYRLHADTRTPLGEHACEQHCDCDEAMPVGQPVSDGGPDA